MIDILIVEDNKELSELMHDFLQADGYSLGVADSGEKAIEMFRKEKARIILLDLMLPGMDGYTVCDEIRQIANVPIIILSAKNQKDDKMLAFELGADDYVEKPFDIDILKAKIKASIRRNQEVDEDVRIDGNIKIDLNAMNVYVNEKQVTMTQKEYQLLLLFLDNPGKVLRKDWIFDQIWGMDSFSEPSTLTVHINKLRDKIEKDPKKPTRIQTVWGVGYKYESIS
jgi:DNA-binding response OmpR family regulator